MKCDKCGAALFPEDQFCGECGAPRPSSSRPADLPESTPSSQKDGVRRPEPPRAAPGSPGVPDGAPSPGSSPGPVARKVLLGILGLLGLGMLILVGGALIIRLTGFDVAAMLPSRSAGRDLPPAGELSLEAFQVAARDCQSVAAVTGIYENVDLDVLVTVERQVRDSCQIRLEVVRDGTDHDLGGKQMTCRIPMQALAEGSQPQGRFEDYCNGSLARAIEQLSEEGR